MKTNIYFESQHPHNEIVLEIGLFGNSFIPRVYNVNTIWYVFVCVEEHEGMWTSVRDWLNGLSLLLFFFGNGRQNTCKRETRMQHDGCI